MTRTAAEIGAGLAPVRPARPIVPGERIHLVGIAGAGASGAGLLARAAGAVVTGCDSGGPSSYTPALDAGGIPVEWQHAAGHVRRDPHPDRLGVTKALTAVAPGNEELAAARELGIPLEPWQQVVADAAAGRRLVAVAGTHGKSTSAGWLVHVLAAAGLDPSAFVGALLPASLSGGVAATARIGRGDVFVVEADEYAGNFDAYRPSVAILTSAEWDHPDVFVDRAAVIDAFEAWLRGSLPAPGGGPPALIANVGDPGVAEIAGRLGDWAGTLIAVALVDLEAGRLGGVAKGIAERYSTALGPAVPLIGRISAATPGGTAMDVHGLDPLGGLALVTLTTAGRHNAANALGVAGAAMTLGLRADEVVAGLASFAGVGRRLERKGEARGVAVYDDYGHHPTALRGTIAAVRQREPGRRVWAVYEPLTYHRTAALLGEFAAALATADAVVVADIWAGRDPDTSITSAGVLAEAVARLRPEIPHEATGSAEATAEWLAGHVRADDAVLVMGGGRSYLIGALLLERLEASGT